MYLRSNLRDPETGIWLVQSQMFDSDGLLYFSDYHKSAVVIWSLSDAGWTARDKFTGEVFATTDTVRLPTDEQRIEAMRMCRERMMENPPPLQKPTHVPHNHTKVLHSRWGL